MFSAAPAFSFDKTRFDMDTYLGRLMHFYSTINPLLMFETESSLKAKAELLDEFKRTGAVPSGSSDAELWKARLARETCIRVDKGKDEIIFPLFRMAAYAPVNVYVVPTMLSETTVASPLRTLWIHWFNQSYNCAVNYSHRAGDSLSISTLMQAYGTAVGVSVAGALGATLFLRSMKDTTSTKAVVVRATLPFFAVAFSGSANVAMMRRQEWTTAGVDVKDEDGEIRGKSVVAGQRGIGKCAAARFLWNIPVMVLPPLLMMPVSKSAFFAGNKKRLFLAETALCVSAVFFGIPPALACFKPIDEVSAGLLEPEFRNLTRKDGTAVKTFSFFKGL